MCYFIEDFTVIGWSNNSISSAPKGDVPEPSYRSFGPCVGVVRH